MAFKIDLHVHTSPRSACSQLDPQALAARAQALGLDGFALTEHSLLWPEGEARALARQAGLVVINAQEVTTSQGDVLVYGHPESITGVMPIAELAAVARESAAFLVAAHPFRGFLLFGLRQLGFDPAREAEREIFKHVHAIETANGRLSPAENQAAAQVAELLGLPGLGGSDAHASAEVGRCFTILEEPVADAAGLAAAVRSGGFSTGAN